LTPRHLAPRLAAGAGVALLTLVGLGTTGRVQQAPPARPNNILFVLTDDLDAAELAYLPHVKTLVADQGVSFANYFVSVSLCCPSRSTMLRGQYSHNTGVKTNGGGNGGFETAFAQGVEKSTVATWLQSGGYRTALYGKYLNGYPATAPANYVPPGWTDWASSVGGNAYAEFNYVLNENGRRVRYQTQPADYGTDVYVGKADAFIRKAAADRAPFFVYLSVYAPHAPATPAPRHANLFAGAKAPRPPSFNEEDVSDKPAFVRNKRRLGTPALNTIDDLYHKRIQSLQAVDEGVARLVETLKATGQLDRTFIVFASDNGFHLGQHRLQAGKQTAYEEDIRVPLIVRGPGVPAGRTVSLFAGNVDLAPTFAAIGGVAAPAFVDGRSLVPLLGATPPPANQWRQAYLIEHWSESPSTAGDESREPVDADQTDAAPAERGQRARGARGARGGEVPSPLPEFHALRTPQYTYVEYVTGERELYDLAKDPYELNNLAPKVGTTLVQTLSARLKQLIACVAAGCRDAEAR
jgi:arylsulfatase A-like enzyme